MTAARPYPSWIYDEHAKRARPPQPVQQPAPQFLTVAEVAKRWRVSKMSVYRRIHEGTLTAVRVGGQFRIPTKAADEYIDGQLS
ncbi:MAG: excisionase family DNA-binding protein [Mycobacteriaceae bacterium]